MDWPVRLAIQLLIRIIPPIGKWLERKLRRPEPREILSRRQEMMAEIRTHLRQPNENGVRGDAIILDVDRIDLYRPHDRLEDGPSNAWLKVEVKGTYPGGLELIYGSAQMVQFDERSSAWVFLDDTQIPPPPDAHGADANRPKVDVVRVWPVGELPVDRIEDINWDGDDYYRCPHIYCKYLGNGRKLFDTTTFYTNVSDTPGRHYWEQVHVLRQRRSRLALPWLR